MNPVVALSFVAETAAGARRSPQDATLRPGERVTPDGVRYSAAWL